MDAIDRLSLLVCGFLWLSAPMQAQDSASLFGQLNRMSTTDRAAQKILDAASTDSSVRRRAAEILPRMIQEGPVNEIWLNAVNLAGKLKLSEAVPSLGDVFSRDIGRSSNTTMTRAALLEDDPVAKALSEIGEPAFAVVSGFLRDGDRRNRKRAVRILLNMNTPVSRNALKEHLEQETDGGIRSLIEHNLN